MLEQVQEWLPLGLAGLAAATMIAFWVVQTARHDARLRSIPIRVHVNGIRGKSTLVRYIAAALREGGIETIAKTTGSATRVIYPDGTEAPVERTGAPTIIEQIGVLREAVRPSTQAIVIECMALQTEYQRVSEERMIRATDGVIANVRRDHVEQLGYELPQIARSLSNTAPWQAPLYTAESDPEILAVLDEEAQRKGGRLVAVSSEDLTKDEKASFGPLAFAENIAIALAIAMRHGVDREVALRGMRKAAPDPGASRVHRHQIGDREIYWIDLFGVNDVPSAHLNIDKISDWLFDDTKVVFVLNNRADRQHRTLQFAKLVAEHEAPDRILLVGENRSILRDTINARGAGAKLEDLDLAGVESPEHLAKRIGLEASDSIALIGLANIHTEDAQRLKALLETEETAWEAGSPTEQSGVRTGERAA